MRTRAGFNFFWWDNCGMTTPTPNPTAREESELALKLVQQRVLSILISVVAAFPIGALIAITKVVLDQGRHGAGVVLISMCALIGVVAASAILTIRQRSALTPLVAIGALPAAIASFWLF